MSKWQHFKALSRKNFILWKRNPGCLIVELLLPIILFGMLIGLRYALKPEKEDPRSFIDDTKYSFYASPEPAEPSSLFSYSSFSTGCAQTTENYLQIGIVGNNSITEEYSSYMKSNHRMLLNRTLGLGFVIH